jgi:hypothetical protein|tara:strand:- start:6263 stop:6397 length:135 start_codon:yes stop_codon:yes gene_type:complete
MNLFGFLKLDKTKRRRRRKTRYQKHNKNKSRIATKKYRKNKKGG